MFFTTPFALLSLGVFLLLTPHFFWNANVIAVGILACLMAFFSVFIDPAFLLMM